LPLSDKALKKRREVSKIASFGIQSVIFSQAMTKYILDKVPSKYHAHMIPDYRTILNYESPAYGLHTRQLQAASGLVGVRCPDLHDIVSNFIFVVANSGFLDSLHRPNLTLNFDGIAEIVENGIVTKAGMCASSLAL